MGNPTRAAFPNIEIYPLGTLYGTCWVRLLGLNVTSCHIKRHLPLVVIRLSWAHRLLTPSFQALDGFESKR